MRQNIQSKYILLRERQEGKREARTSGDVTESVICNTDKEQKQIKHLIRAHNATEIESKKSNKHAVMSKNTGSTKHN